MCGIAGILKWEPKAPVSQQALWEMLEPIQNRGPDKQQVWHSRGIGFGHVRLKILDLDARSDQPMVDPQTGCIIVYNGEIYNYIEIREELQTKGYVFYTSGDTEVVLKAYDYWGSECLNRFNGMWSFALYDPRIQKLFCARDRFGIKPFVYAMDNHQLVFASESKSILNAFPHFRQPHWEFLKHFVEVGDFAGTEDTFHENIFNLLPGHYFMAGHGEIPTPKRYWQWQPQVKYPVLPDLECVELFKVLLGDAIRLRFRSDVPVGACLSGGMDSSSIVAMAAKMFDAPVSTFSCIYPEIPEVDESAYIRKTTERFGCQAYWVTPQFEDFKQTMVQCIWEQDGPTGSPAVLSQRAVMSRAHGRVTVLLDGQGGDEVLGGYHSYFPFSLQTQMRRLIRRPSVSGLVGYLTSLHAIKERTGGRDIPKFHRIRKNAKEPLAFSRKRFGPSVLDLVSPCAEDDLSTRMMEDLLLTLPNLLHYEDRNSMAFSLESRLPFLDYRLVEFLYSLPHQFKIRKSRTKFLLHETMKGILPDEILSRRDKMGFSTPGQVWYRQPQALKDLNPYLQSPPEFMKLLIDPEVLESLQQQWQLCMEGEPITARSEANLWRYWASCFWVESQLEVSGVQSSAMSSDFSPLSV